MAPVFNHVYSPPPPSTPKHTHESFSCAITSKPSTAQKKQGDSFFLGSANASNIASITHSWVDHLASSHLCATWRIHNKQTNKQTKISGDYPIMHARIFTHAHPPFRSNPHLMYSNMRINYYLSTFLYTDDDHHLGKEKRKASSNGSFSSQRQRHATTI